MRFWSKASSRVPHEGISSTSKSAHDFGGKSGCKIALRTLSPYLYTGFYWNMISFISGGERRCIKPIKICPDWVTYGVELGCKRALYAKEHYLRIYAQYFYEIWPQAPSRVPNYAGVLRPSKSAAWFGVIVHRVKLGWNMHRVYIFLSIHRMWMSNVHVRSTVCVERYVLDELPDQWILHQDVDYV